MKKISTIFVTALLAVLPTCAFAQAWGEPLYVAGHQVTGQKNIVSVTGEGIEGTVTYNYTKKELTLDNATITVNGKGVVGIENGDDLETVIEGLKIIVKGECEIKAEGSDDDNTKNHGLMSRSSLTIDIDYDSHLDIESDGYGISFVGENLEITGKQFSYLSVDAENNGILTLGDITAKCMILIDVPTEKTALTCYGEFKCAENYGDIIGSSEFSTEKYTFVNNSDGKNANVLYLGKYYEIYIGGTQLNEFAFLLEHKMSVFSEEEEESVTYDDEAKLLTINAENYSSSGDDEPFIENRGEDGLTIKFTAADFKLSYNYSVFRIHANTTIEGEFNYLTLDAPGFECFYVLDGATLTLRNLNVIGTGDWGIGGPNKPSKETLIIRNCYLDFDCVYGAICDFKKIDLGNCKITEPSDGRIDIAGNYENYAIVGGDGNWAKHVVIDIDDESDVNAPVSNNAKVSKVYNVSGVQQQKLTRGLNILRMDNGTVRKVLKK